MIVIQNNVLIDGTDTYLQFKDVTGEYTVNNTGGYGTPNTDRNNLALLFYAKRIPYTGNEIIVSLNDPYIDYDAGYANNYKSTFSFAYDKDGWYKAWIIAVPLTYDIPVEDNIRYNSNLSKLQIYTTEWVDFDITANGSEDLLLGGDYEYGFYEDIFQLNLIDQKNCATVDYIDCLQCDSCKCDKHFENATKSQTMIQAIDYIFYSNKKYEAVKLLEKANKEFKCCK